MAAAAPAVRPVTTPARPVISPPAPPPSFTVPSITPSTSSPSRMTTTPAPLRVRSAMVLFAFLVGGELVRPNDAEVAHLRRREDVMPIADVELGDGDAHVLGELDALLAEGASAVGEQTGPVVRVHQCA